MGIPALLKGKIIRASQWGANGTPQAVAAQRERMGLKAFQAFCSRHRIKFLEKEANETGFVVVVRKTAEQRLRNFAEAHGGDGERKLERLCGRILEAASESHDLIRNVLDEGHQ